MEAGLEVACNDSKKSRQVKAFIKECAIGDLPLFVSGHWTMLGCPTCEIWLYAVAGQNVFADINDTL